MKKQYDNIDSYYIAIFNKLLIIAPLVGVSAAMTITISWLLGKYSFVDVKSVIIFDCICISYIFIGYYLKKKGIVKNGKLINRLLNEAEIAVCVLVILQWNLISYFFPTRDFWGFAPLFLLIPALFFHSKTIFYEEVFLSISILISWILLGDKLLPIRDEYFFENLILRVVSLAISSFLIYYLTRISEKFMKQVKDNFNSIEKQNDDLEALGKDIIDFTASLIEDRDSTSGYHVKRLKSFTKILASEIAINYPEYDLDEDKIEIITFASVLHDVGKIAIPDNILLKPGKLTDEEFNIIKNHTILGAKMIDRLPDSIGVEYKTCCKEICQFHHEKIDGKGYPVGLKGDEIPISAQIVSVVDCFDALTNERPYKNALPGEMAINMILNGECGEFSNKIKKCLVNCKDKFLCS